MKAALTKHEVIALYCYCAQARPSVHRVLSAPPQWPNFVAYYDEHKRNAISDLVALLKRAGAVPNQSITRNSFSENILPAMVWSLVGPLVNKRKQAWSFSQKQLSFICTTLETLLRILQLPEPPKSQELANLRMDFYACQWIIDRKMLGVPELGDAARIEHFHQSESLEHVTLREMGVDPTEVSS